MYDPRVSHERHWGRVSVQRKRFGWRKSHTRRMPVTASATLARTMDASGVSGRQGSSSASTAGTRKAPAAIDFVHRYADTFQPHELRCCSLTPYVRRGPPPSSPARQVRQVDPRLGDAGIKPLAQLLQLFGPGQVRRLDFAVVGGSEDAVRALLSVEHEAAAADCRGHRVFDFVALIEQQAERSPGVRVGCVFVGRFLVGVGIDALQQADDVMRDAERVRAIRRLVGDGPAQSGQSHAQVCREGKARRLQHIFRFLDHRFAHDARPAHLRDRVEQQAARGLGAARVVKRQRPGLETVPQVVPHAGQAFGHACLGAELLEQLEQHSRHGLSGEQALVQLRIAVRQAQCQAVRSAAKRSEIVAVE